MKRLILSILLSTMLILSGCAQTKEFRIEYEPLEEEQVQLLSLTGNMLFQYKLLDMPADKAYELQLVYEVYAHGKKVKEQMITGSQYVQGEDSSAQEMLYFNIRDQKLRYLTGENGGIYGSMDLEEDLESMSRQFLSETTSIKSGDEIYLVHWMSGESGFSTSGLGKLEDEEKARYLQEHESNVFIKLVCKES